ncbi:hypothetical protein BDV06DRAFT_234489 [Aspergillus oleicola]
MTTTKNSSTAPSRFPLAGLANDGWSNEHEATATCFCGAVQLAVPLKAPALVNTFLCHCADCHKITSSMFTSNFTALSSSVRHIRGQSNLKTLKQDKTPSSGSAVTNFTCGTCGSLMYRVSEAFPSIMVLRTGTVDDFGLHGSVFKPGVEVFTGCRAGWLGRVEGAMQDEGLVFEA